MPTEVAAKHASIVRSYQDLRVWQLGMELVAQSYKITQGLPSFEKYGLASQIRRASVSIPANIAEGHGRDHLGDYLRFLSIAKGSLTELETEMLIGVKLGYLPDDSIKDLLKQTNELGRMLTGLTKALRRHSRT